MRRRFNIPVVMQACDILLSEDWRAVYGRWSDMDRASVVTREAVVGALVVVAEASFPQVAGALAKRHHSGVLDAYRRFERWPRVMRSLWLDAVRGECEWITDEGRPRTRNGRRLDQVSQVDPDRWEGPFCVTQQ